MSNDTDLNWVPPGHRGACLRGGPFDHTNHYVEKEWDTLALPLNGFEYVYIPAINQQDVKPHQRLFQYVGREPIPDGDT